MKSTMSALTRARGAEFSQFNGWQMPARYGDTGAEVQTAHRSAVLRVEDGLPVYGRELTDEHNPWEAGLNDAIHMNKGCYIGQEVIARLDSYDKVKQHLVGLRWTDGPLPPANAELAADGKVVGRITSAVHSPHLRQNIALAYVRRAHCEPGTRLAFAVDDLRQTVEVTGLPFSSEA